MLTRESSSSSALSLELVNPTVSTRSVLRLVHQNLLDQLIDHSEREGRLVPEMLEILAFEPVAVSHDLMVRTYNVLSRQHLAAEARRPRPAGSSPRALAKYVAKWGRFVMQRFLLRLFPALRFQNELNAILLAQLARGRFGGGKA